jgi:glycosyltransferase involved in cell wall biosynthesis
MKNKYLNSNKVILSASVSHYIYTAISLYKGNKLKKFICGPTQISKNSIIYKIMPEYWRNKLKGRDVSSIDHGYYKSIWYAYAMGWLFKKLHFSQDIVNLVHNLIFDMFASFYVDNCSAFHFTSGVGLYSARKAKKRGSKIICDIRSEYPDYQQLILEEEYELLKLPHKYKKSIYDNRVKAEYGISDYLIVPSSYAKETFINAGYDESKIVVLPYGVDQNQFFPSLIDNEDTTNKFRVLFVGQITIRKGIHYLVNAFNKLSLPNSELVLVGSIDKLFEQFLSKNINSNPNIKIVGNISKIDLYRVYNSASVFVLPSLADSWGLVVLEAMACGLPVIVTENTGSKEAVVDRVNGFVVPIRDELSIYQRLLYLYQNPIEKIKMGEAALKSARKMTWEGYGDKLMKLYEELQI